MDWKQLAAKAAPVVVNVHVELPYGREMDIPLSTLSYGEWMAIEAAIPEPAIPRTLAGPGGTKVPNRDDVQFRAELARVNEERAYRRLALALQKGGTDIPGATPAEQVEHLKAELDAGVSNALLVFLASAAMNGKAAAEAAADTFRK